MITYAQIQNKLTKAVEQSELTKAEIAEEIGIKETALDKYLYGNTKPPVYIFANLCKILNLDANDILCVATYNENKKHRQI
ncbi:MAG: helix-turn-helix transcriptional regulator [Clostridiales bacterium]|nr:helix-turn-helix transcriptional regulator [Clostridiales bacterium]